MDENTGTHVDAPSHFIKGKRSIDQIALADLDTLPPTGATVIVGVLPVKDGSQAQTRVLALLP